MRAVTSVHAEQASKHRSRNPMRLSFEERGRRRERIRPGMDAETKPYE